MIQKGISSYCYTVNVFVYSIHKAVGTCFRHDDVLCVIFLALLLIVFRQAYVDAVRVKSEYYDVSRSLLFYPFSSNFIHNMYAILHFMCFICNPLSIRSTCTKSQTQIKKLAVITKNVKKSISEGSITYWTPSMTFVEFLGTKLGRISRRRQMSTKGIM